MTNWRIRFPQTLLASDKDAFESLFSGAGICLGLLAIGYRLACDNLSAWLYPLCMMLVALAYFGKKTERQAALQRRCAQLARATERAQELLDQARREHLEARKALKGKERTIETLIIALKAYESDTSPSRFTERGLVPHKIRSD